MMIYVRKIDPIRIFAEELRRRIVEEMTQVQTEYSQERLAHQKLLAEKDILETRVECLERELLQVNNSNSHRRNLSDTSNISMQDDVSYFITATCHSLTSCRVN
jgi:hypothetical protein